MILRATLVVILAMSIAANVLLHLVSAYDPKPGKPGFPMQGDTILEWIP